MEGSGVGEIVAGETIVIVEEPHAARGVRRQQAKDDARFRRVMRHAAIGMCLVAPDGRFEEVNDALCQFLGYDADTLTQKTWQELTVDEYMDEDQKNADDLLAKVESKVSRDPSWAKGLRPLLMELRELKTDERAEAYAKVLAAIE